MPQDIADLFPSRLAKSEMGEIPEGWIVLGPQPPLPNQFAYFLDRGAKLREFAIRNMSDTSARQRAPPIALRAYGSRVSGLAHEGSDLDFVLWGPGLEMIRFDWLLDFEEAVRNPPFRSSSRRGIGLGCRSGFTGRLSASMWWWWAPPARSRPRSRLIAPRES